MFAWKNKTLYVDGFGLRLGKKSRRLQVISNDELVEEVPLLKIDEVVLCGRGIMISTDLVENLCEAGIIVVFLDSISRPFAAISTFRAENRIKLRTEQIKLAEDERILLANKILSTKMYRQEAVIKKLGGLLPMPTMATQPTMPKSSD